ncbi:DUF5085 family protein [Paenibacillus sp. GCM10027627]|uniref:DUF5085 family protein n=1 Tax=unclassified Paenibacillus TaxID=185978 RepID=UPI00363E385B
MIINPHDDLQASNVISREYSFHYEELQLHLTQFLEEVNKMRVSVKGPFFYSLNNVPLDEVVKVEFFISIEEDLPKETEGFKFRSYFGIESMISLCLYSNFEMNTEEAYARLLYHIRANGMEQTTPIFHVMSGDHEFPYTYIKIGVVQKSNEEMWS